MRNRFDSGYIDFNVLFLISFPKMYDDDVIFMNIFASIDNHKKKEIKTYD